MSDPYRAIRDGLREELVREVGRHRYRLWFRDTEVHDVAAERVTLAVPTEVHRTWLECTYAPQLRRAVDNVFGEGMQVELRLSRTPGTQARSQRATAAAAAGVGGAPRTPPSGAYARWVRL